MEGLYKVEYDINDGSGRSVLYAHAGKMLGGNTAFAHFGTYEIVEGEIVARLRTKRHSRSPQHRSLVSSDAVTISIRGRPQGKLYRFEGEVVEDASVFRAVMTPLGDEDVPPPGAVGEGGIVSGLYSIDIRMLDGITGGHTGVMLLRDGRILGGDAFFYYLGAYSSANGRWKGEFVNQEHTPAKSEHPLFGGYEVGIGFSGHCDDKGADMEAIALAGKRSIRLAATLKLIEPFARASR
ncbi:GrlR family regulatory protein [Bradyrhizobium sp. 613_E4_N2_2]|uniref:GrlR family regulatory protein n=1 Tax=Bradyrhizobium sp. 613_E4_N2_2 TaxID=3240371 RepID=UPI003F8AE53F